MSDRPKVLVAGATGYLGKHVVRALTEAGYPVRALARNPERLGDVRDLCTDVVVAEATKPETLTDLVGDATVMFSSLGKHDFKRKPTVWDIDHQANLNLVERAAAGGVKHFVFISVVHAEELAARGMDQAIAREKVVEAARATSMTTTVLRPSGFFNDMADFFEMARKGTGWVLGDGSSRMNPIHGADLAAEVVRVIGDPTTHGQSLSVGGPDVLTYNQIMELAFAALGKKPRLRRVPLWTVRPVPYLVRPFNPMVGGLIGAVLAMADLGAVARPVGTHHLADFFVELAATSRTR